MIVLSVLCSATSFAQGKITVTGQIVGDDGLPVIGASVMVAGTTTGVVADLDGKYSIEAKEDDVLVFSCIGFTEERKKVEGKKPINIVLQSDSKMLQETVVIGYGSVKKEDLTGSVGVVNMDKIANPATVSVDQALQGRVAGMDIQSAGGEPGEASSIRIRGTRSINASNDPLIVVDGVVDAVESFSDINPDDIKSISVLKDASSTAIYGARGSNGVILVTTKGQERTKLSVSFTANVGVSQLLKELDIMNGTEFAQWRNDLTYIKNMSSTTGPTAPMEVGGSYPFANPAIYGEGTNWQRVLTRNGLQQGYKFAVNRGDSKSHMYFSFGYDNNQGIIIGSDMQRYTAFLKADYKFFKWLTAGFRFNYTYRHNDLNKIKINGQNAYSACSLSPLLGPEDKWNKYSDNSGSGASVYDSPYLQAKNETNYRNGSYINVTPWIEIRPLQCLSLKSTFSTTLTDAETYYYSPSYMPLAQSRQTGGTATWADTKRKTFLSETTLTFKKNYNKAHDLNIMGGFTAQRSIENYDYIKGVGYLDDKVGPDNLSGVMDKRNLTVNSKISDIRRMSVIARANYSFKSRYYVTLTGRADGSSMFAEGHKWAFFPAAAFKWTLSNESWMSMAKAKGTALSLRLSAGRSGNDSVASYASQAALTSASSTWLFGENQELSYYPARLDNESLTWEITDSYNVGVDLSLLHDRITMTAEAYLSNTSGLLLSLQNAQTTGFSTRLANAGSTRGYGFEYSITSHNIVKPRFSWETNFTISHDNSIVTDLGIGNEYVPTMSKGGIMIFGYKQGYPANALWGFQYCGVWHNDAERSQNKITKSYVSYQDKNGYSKYADVNHDGILDKNDMVYLGSSDPIVYGGFNNTFNIYGFTLGIYFTYSIGGKIYNLSEFNLGSAVGSSNKYRYMMDGWHPVRNPDSDIPSAYSSDGYASDRYVHDASYLRLKTLSIGYTFDLSSKVKWLRDIAVSAYVDNLFLVAGYNGYDPDVTSSKSIRRLDDASYPNPRTFMFSVKFRY